MAQKIEIISNASVLLGGEPISALSEGISGVLGDAFYENTYRDLLSMHPWRFAMKKRKLAKTTTVPINEYKYEYQLPSDCVVVRRVNEGLDYDIFEDKIFTNYNDVSIEYTYRPTETILPDYFTATLQFLLASLFAVPITDNVSKGEFYTILYDKKLKVAKMIDSQSRPTTPIQSNPLGIR